MKADYAGRLFDLVLRPKSEEGGRMLTALGEDVLQLGQWMAGIRLASSRATFRSLRMAMRDKYGAVQDFATVIGRWSADDWSRVKWETITRDQLVELSDLRLEWPAMHENIRKWCPQTGARWREFAGFTYAQASDAWQ